MKASEFLHSNPDSPFVNYNLVVFLLFLENGKHELLFKMLGGQNAHSYGILKGIRDFDRIANESNIGGFYITVRDGMITGSNHYKVAVAIKKGLEINLIDDPNNAPVFITDEKWLIKTFEPIEQKLIKDKLAEIRGEGRGIVERKEVKPLSEPEVEKPSSTPSDIPSKDNTTKSKKGK